MLTGHFAATRLKGVDIVPAVGVKRILYQRRAHQKNHLLFTHPDTQALNGFMIEGITLADINFVERAALGGQRQTKQYKSCNENFSHFEFEYQL